MLLKLTTPSGNTRGPQYMEAVLSVLHEAGRRHGPVSLVIARSGDSIALFIACPESLKSTVQTQILASYPQIELKRVPDAHLAPQPADETYEAKLLLRPDIFPIRRFSQFEDALNRDLADPLMRLLSVLSPRRGDPVSASIVIEIQPAVQRRIRHRDRLLRVLQSERCLRSPRITRLYCLAATSPTLPVRVAATVLSVFIRTNGEQSGRATSESVLSASSTRTHERESDYVSAADKLSRHVFAAEIRLRASAANSGSALCEAKIREIASAFGQFTQPRLNRFRLRSVRRMKKWKAPTTILRTALLRWAESHASFLLSSEELATLWHPPTETVQVERLDSVTFPEREPPATLPSPREAGAACLGRTRFRGRKEVFGILVDDRRRHLAVIGKTGMGKSTLLSNLIVSDIEAGRGVALIDPHGDLANGILELIPKCRTNDVVLFDATDRAFPVAFNPLSCDDTAKRPLVASGIVTSLKKIFGDSWGPRLEHILRNAVLALLEQPDATLLSLLDLLTDRSFRDQIVSRTSDEIVRRFWEHEFGSWKPHFQAEAIAPVLNKIGAFLSNPIIREIIREPRSKINFRRIMDDSQVLIVNLSKGQIGEDASALLGALLISNLQIAAMGRADIGQEKRPDFQLYVDEFQNFATESFATILSEARKYRLSLTIANQYLAQMDEATMEAVFGNVGSLLCFQVGARDAELLAEQLGGGLEPADLLSIPKFAAYLRLLIDGMPSRAFSMTTLPPKEAADGALQAKRIRQVSRRRYARGGRAFRDRSNAARPPL